MDANDVPSQRLARSDQLLTSPLMKMVLVMHKLDGGGATVGGFDVAMR
jgi:hypothetical protein